MADIDRTIVELRAQLDEIVTRRASGPTDEDLIAAVDDGSAREDDMSRLGRRLKPHVRAQLLRCGIWRYGHRVSGGELGFVPTMAMQVVVEICSYEADVLLPVGLEHQFELLLSPSWKQWGREPNHGWAHLCYLEWAQARVLLEVTGTTDCRAIREELDRWDADWTPTGSDLLADARAMALAEPLRRHPACNSYRLVSPIGIPLP